MQEDKFTRHIAIVGGGPAGMFMYKRLVESGQENIHISIFEKQEEVGPGMPYSKEGARKEHITNVSGNEIPEIMHSVKEWIDAASPGILQPFDIKPATFNDYKVLPRLLFGRYLAAQFEQLKLKAKQAGIGTKLLANIIVTDIEDHSDQNKVTVHTENGDVYSFDTVIICTGHSWPKLHEGQVENWFDSPYPPSKLARKVDYPVAIKGASLTAIDAVRTLARENGRFKKNDDGSLTYEVNANSTGFRIHMHSLDGLLPAIRFHLEDSHLSQSPGLSEAEVHAIMADNDGFIPLDTIFERNFKLPVKENHRVFYEQIRDMSLEAFVAHMMELREKLDPFVLFKAEYAEAEKSIKRHQSVYWKEMLAVLSYAMNYPAKHLSAEDMLRLKTVLMPLISIVIAFVPQSSCRELIALHDAGILTVVPVDKESKTEPAAKGGVMYSHKDENGVQQETHYKMFIDAVGQVPVMYKDFPFESLRKNGTVSEAYLRFRNPEQGISELNKGNKSVSILDNNTAYLQVPGVNINDHFQALDKYGVYNNRVYIMAVPLIAGLNPDYSGLDFCEAASGRILKAMMETVGV